MSASADERQDRFAALLGAAPAIDGVTPDVGSAIRVLASSKPAATVLQLGPVAPALTSWLLEGMDILSQLIVVTPDDAERAALAACFDDEIRITVHSQDLGSFLQDVHRHSFDLIVVRDQAIDTSLAAPIRARLAVGGLIAVLGGTGADPAPPEAVAARWSADGWPGAPWLMDGALCVVARSADGARPVRQGRRRGRQREE